MTSTPLQFAVKMSKASQAAKVAPRAITTRAALTVKGSVQKQLAVAAPSGRLNVGKRGARVGVRYDLRGDDVAVVRMTGPAHLIERDTKPHQIPHRHRGRGRSRTRNVKRIYIPGVGVRMSAQHPGTKGKHPWAKGVAAAIPDVGKVAGRYYFDTVRKALG